MNVTRMTVCSFLFCALLSGAGFAADVTWTGAGGDGLWSNDANWSGGSASLSTNAAVFANVVPSAVTVSANTTCQQIRVTGAVNPVITVASGATLTLSNAGGLGFDVRAGNLTVDGPGLLTMSTAGSASSDNHLDNGVNAGFTLALNAKITGATGFEGWRATADTPGGLIAFGYAANDYTFNNSLNGGMQFSVVKLANGGQPSSLGAGTYVVLGGGPFHRLIYLGSGDSTDRDYRISGSPARLVQAGSGPLIFTGPVRSTMSSAATLTLDGDASAAAARISGPVSQNGANALSIVKEGSGTWVLAGSNTFSGSLTVNAGTLGLDATTNAFGKVAAMTVNAGATLAINPSATDGFAVTLPPLNGFGDAAVTVAQAPNSSTVTFSALNIAGSLALTAPGVGTDANRIFVNSLPTGVVGPWLTLNGGSAAYDPVTGLVPTSVTTSSLATKGSVLPDGADIKAVIDSVGTGSDIALPANPTRLYSLTQTVAEEAATVNTAGKTLYAGEIAVASAAAALTLGALSQDGTLLPPVTEFAAPVIPDSSAVAALAPTIWYDPSDAASVRVYLGTVTGLVNKGTAGPTLNAIVRTGFTAPLYATGADSHAALPTLRFIVTSQGLQSLANCGVSGNAPRTIVCVLSRDAGKEMIVSMGTGGTRNAFEPYLRNDFTRFGTFGNDIDMPVKPSATPVVLTMLNGVGGVNDAFQGFVDSVASAVKNGGVLATTATPLCIGHRNGSGSDNYRGQIGEVLFFNRTLNDTERGTVEAYLAAKWQQARPASSTVTTLSLRNDSAAPLTVNAAVIPPDYNVVGLDKDGTGDVTFAGGVTVTGPVRIEAGALTVNTPAETLDTLGLLSGAGALIKGGCGILALPSATANSYAGGTLVTGGVLRVGNNAALGTGALVISGEGTLDLGGGTAANTLVLPNRITVSGAGAKGQGAIVNTGFQQMNVFQNTVVTLADDAVFGGPLRWDLRGAGATLDLAGHTLAKTGTFNLVFSGSGISNAPAGTALDIHQGMLSIESGSVLSPNTAMQKVSIASGASLGLYGLTTPVNWGIIPADGAAIVATGTDAATNRNTLTADIALNGTLNLTASGVFGKNLAGLLSGEGGLSVSNGGLFAVSLLSHPANTFAGLLSVTNAVLGLKYPGSLPDAANLMLKGQSAVRVYPVTWTGSAVEALAESGKFGIGINRLQLEVGAGETAYIDASVGAPFRGELDKHGAGELGLGGDWTLAANARTYAGTLTLTNAVVFNLGNYGFYLGDGTGADTTLNVGGNAQFLTTDRGAGVNAAGIVVGTHSGCKAVVNVTSNAFVRGKLKVGGADLADTNTVGAVYQSGNSRWNCPAGNDNDGMIGMYGYGLYQLDGGELAINGGTQFGVMRNSPKSIGIFRQTGGRFTFSNGYGGTFAFSRGGVGVAQFEGGTATITQLELLDDYNNNGESGNNVAGGTAVATVSGSADVTTGAEVLFGNRTNGAQTATAILNLNGGKLTTTYLRRLNKAANCAVNFNGGILCVTNSAGGTKLIAADNAALPLSACVYAGGAVIELGTGVGRSLDVPLTPAIGAGVAVIPLTAGGSGYIAPPYVSITGGGGSNATAFAHIDRATGALTAIEVTSPGQGYTSSPTVTLIGGGGTGAAVGYVTIGGNLATGGLTKRGPGTLILNVPNTYRGVTRIEGGVLKLSHPQALPATGIVIGDGTLDLGGYTVTNSSVTVSGTGAVINGKIVAASVVKTGAGTAAWDANIELARVPTALIPGLYEGRVDSAFNTTAVNPCTAIELTTTAANGVSVSGDPVFLNGKEWRNNTTYIYTGYLWNRASTNVTWTFLKAFDDSLMLTIDGTNVINHTGWSTVVKTNVTLSSGPHRFEARFGQGAGGVGGTAGSTTDPASAWWTPAVRGLSVDKLGRNGQVYANYTVLADPGDGSLFTVNLPDSGTPDAVVRVAEGTLRLPPCQPGTWQGTLYHNRAPSGYRNLTAPNPKTAVVLAFDQANSRTRFDSNPPYWNAGDAWPTNMTECYSGYIWNRSSVTTNLTLYKNFDDTIDLWLDGAAVAVTGGNSWDTIGLMTLSLTPGPHSLEVRFGQAAGGAGPSTSPALISAGWPENVAFGVDWLGRGVATPANFVKLQDAGDGSLLTLTPYSGDADVLDGVTVEVAEGAALDLGGIPRDGIDITGGGTVLNSAGGANTVFSPAGDVRTGAMSVSDGSLAGATYRLTIHDAATHVPGLWEGMLKGTGAADYWDIATPNPKASVQLTTRAGNGTIAANTTYAGGLWAGNYHTWVYTGTLWVNSLTNVTWTWRFTFDDNVALWLDGQLVRNVGLAAGIQYQDWVMTPGPHAIEVRYGDGNGNVGPASGLGGLSYDPLGRGAYSALGNFILLADSGEGTVLSLTSDEGAHDVITLSGALDLTGLTVVPSDALSETPSGSEYVILHAEGGLTGTATVSGFTNKKWKLRKRGNDLLLTTQGGSLMLLK